MTYFNSKVRCQFIKPETESLLVIEPEGDLNVFDWVKENKNLLEKYIMKYDGVLLRSFGIYSVSEFNKVVQIMFIALPRELDWVVRFIQPQNTQQIEQSLYIMKILIQNPGLIKSSFLV